MSSHENAAPVDTPFFTRGVMLLSAVMVTGIGFGLYRMLFSLAAVTNLNDQYPLGLWIGIDVARGVALAAGGFTTGALVSIFNREHFHAIIRPALLISFIPFIHPDKIILIGLKRMKWNISHPARPGHPDINIQKIPAFNREFLSSQQVKNEIVTERGISFFFIKSTNLLKR